MIPLNNHVQIEPEVKEDFITSSDTTYNEVGIVVAVAPIGVHWIQVGDRVFFDSWTAAKYPKKEGGFYWLVDYANIRAYESLSQESVQGGVPAQVQDSTVTESGATGTMRTVRDENVFSSRHSEP